MNGEPLDRGTRERLFPMADWVISGLLFLAVFVVYVQTGFFSYVNLDDPYRVAQNTHVLSGLSWDNVRWAITSRESADSYPLTWISFQLVAQLFGPAAGPQHLTNVLIHAINSVLVFQVFKSLTGRTGPSAIVAGLFALHPLHVESVAWVSGRKDVLSTLFWLLAVGAYSDFVRTAKLKS
jgi:protein O-mannosyl-transferase